VFNRIDKISENVLPVWSKLRKALPGSLIVIKNGAMDDPYLRDGLIGRFAVHGVSQDKIRCIGATTRHEHLATFSDIDISLDPFPQNGGISTWESLQMGVPVVAKLGISSSSRLAAAILKAVDLDDWVADDDDGYLAIAQKYASRAPQLDALRAKLPAMLAGSEAGNVEIYTKRVEEGYRRFWRDYCASVSELADGA
jgi:predicted O-linked N-acetylglucosamine transferase (SPINDLY family)